MKFLSGFVSKSVPSTLSDPFKVQHVVRVHMSANRSLFNKSEWNFYGSVEFQNGSTKGEQSFQGKSMDDIAKKIDAFIQELEK